MNNAPATNPHADYYAKKERVMAALANMGATSVESAATVDDLTAFGGEALASLAVMVEARGAEVKYRAGAGYYLGRVRHNGRS